MARDSKRLRHAAGEHNLSTIDLFPHLIHLISVSYNANLVGS
jgi:hypothetical protein